MHVCIAQYQEDQALPNRSYCTTSCPGPCHFPENHIVGFLKNLLANYTFNSLQRFSMGLRSGDWLGHSRTLKCFLRSHSFVARAVCLGSLSCWKIQPRFIFNALADGRRFSLKISRYMAPFILSFTQISRPGPFAEKQPQSMMFPHPCFTVGMVFFGCNSAFFLLQTRQVELLPKSYILVSSDLMTFPQSFSGSSKCSLANFRWPGYVLA